MNIKEAKEEIKRTLKAYTLPFGSPGYLSPVHQRPILLIGPPGIGKTAIMEQIAAECGVGLVAYTMTHHTRQSAIGLPFLEQKTYQGKEYSITRYTMSEIVASLYDYMEATGKRTGILFLDEINCVSETLMPVMLQFLQNKTFGNHPLPEGWVIVAAGNPPEYNQSVRELDTVTLDRVKRMTIDADLSIFREYAASHGIHPAVQAYLTLHPEHFYVVKQDGMETRFVTARGWEDLSCILLSYEAIGEEVVPTLFPQYLQEENIAKSFASYYRMFAKRQRSLNLSGYLAGTADEKETQRLSQFLSQASPDEELGAAALSSSYLLGRIEDFSRERTTLIRLRELFSKSFSLLEKADSPFLSLLGDFLKKQRELLKVQRRTALLSIPDALEQEAVLSLYEEAVLTLPDPPASLSSIREGIHQFYDARLLAHQEKASTLLASLTRAYELFSGAGKEEALLYLTTDLSKNKEAVTFLMEYSCPLYEIFSSKLLMTERERALRKEIEHLSPSLPL